MDIEKQVATVMFFLSLIHVYNIKNVKQ